MFSIFIHVMKSVRDTNSEPGLPVLPVQISRLYLQPIRIRQG